MNGNSNIKPNFVYLHWLILSKRPHCSSRRMSSEKSSHRRTQIFIYWFEEQRILQVCKCELSENHDIVITNLYYISLFIQNDEGTVLCVAIFRTFLRKDEYSLCTRTVKHNIERAISLFVLFWECGDIMMC